MSVKHYLFRLCKIPVSQWPGKITFFLIRHIPELMQEILARVCFALNFAKNWDLQSASSQLQRDDSNTRFFICFNQRETILQTLWKVAPKAETLIINRAEHVCSHIFDLLGSGPKALGENFDWHTDFKSGYRWNPRTYYKRIHPAPFPGGYDIKVPWELNRCQHFVWLGQAYWITNDKKYVHEFINQVTNWIESNPCPWGVNWACTMDVAIRAVNWLWGYHFFKESTELSAEFILTFRKSLLIHGRHIFRNLENKSDINTNHYLSNLVGLIYLGILCPEFEETFEWKNFGIKELWQELSKQIDNNGVNFEGSIAYHRFSTELFLSSFLLCRVNSILVPNEVVTQLEKMFEFIMYYTKPNGTVPLIGDTDNGRLHRLAIWQEPEREWNDHRYLLAIASILFERNDFRLAAGDQWQEAVWLMSAYHLYDYPSFDSQCPPSISNFTHTVQSMGFPQSGIYILRKNNTYTSIRLGNVGTQGKGNHSHNDALSVEIAFAEETFITDPGSYVYTQDYQGRNHFRSSKAHNAPVTNDMEIHKFDSVELFRMSQRAICAVEEWNIKNSVIFKGKCTYNMGGGLPIIHSRKITLSENGDLVTVEDYVHGQGQHTVTLRYVLGMDIIPKLVSEKPLYVMLKGKKSEVILHINGVIANEVTIQNDWISTSYGSLTTVKSLSLAFKTYLPWKLTWMVGKHTAIARQQND